MKNWNAIHHLLVDNYIAIAEKNESIANMEYKDTFNNNKAFGRDTIAQPITYDEAIAMAKKNTIKRELANAAIWTAIAVLGY